MKYGYFIQNKIIYQNSHQFFSFQFIFKFVKLKMNPSQYRKLPRHYTGPQTFLLQLSEQQALTLTHFLPKGHSIVSESRSKAKQQILKMRLQQNSSFNQGHNQSSSAKQTPVVKQSVSLPKNTQKAPIKKGLKQQIPQIVKPCLKIIQKLKAHQKAWPFLQPVNPDILGIPEYYEIVTEPMDLSTIEKKYKAAAYKTPQQFYNDVNLMIKNSYIFNEANEDFLELTRDYQRYFFRIAGTEAKPVIDKKLEKQKQRERERLERQKLKEQKLKQKMMQKQKERQRKLLIQQQQQAELALKLAKKKKKMIPKDILEAQNIPFQQKLQLSMNIHNLPKQHLKGVRQIVFDASKTQDVQSSIPNQNQFDIEKIGFKKIRQLQKYVRIKLHQIQTNKMSQQQMDKKQEIDLDAMQSQWTQQFVE